MIPSEAARGRYLTRKCLKAASDNTNGLICIVLLPLAAGEALLCLSSVYLGHLSHVTSGHYLGAQWPPPAQ